MRRRPAVELDVWSAELTGVLRDRSVERDSGGRPTGTERLVDDRAA